MEIAQQELLRRLFERADDHALLFLDPNGLVIGWLAGSERIFGFPASEIIGQSVTVLFTPEDIRAGIPAYEMEAARVTGTSEDDRWHVRKDGSRFWASGTMHALRQDDGALLAYGKVVRDRTDTKAQLRQLTNEVSALQARLKQEQNFRAELAHEMRNALMPIGHSVEAMLHAAPHSQQTKYAGAIAKTQLETLNRLSDDLMEAARLELGKTVLRLEAVELNELLRRVHEGCRPLIDRRRQKISLVGVPAPVKVNGDKVRLQQVFTNLLTNAIKYTPEEGDIAIRLSTEGEAVVVRVVDSGAGLPANMLPRIFDLFTQVEREDPHAASGLGLGLHLVKEFVALHGGSVQVRSDGVGKGSEFVVRLPLVS